MRFINKRKISAKIFQPYQKELAKPNALIPKDTYDNFKNFNGYNKEIITNNH